MVGLMLALVVGTAGRAGAAWVVDAQGACVQQWQAADLGRGPSAVANAPLLPVRTAVGGFQLARDDRAPGALRKVMLPAMLTLGGGAMGVLESLVWVGTGVADTLTGGFFAIAPDEATHLSVAAVRPGFAPPPPATTDPCGRPTSGR